MRRQQQHSNLALRERRQPGNSCAARPAGVLPGAVGVAAGEALVGGGVAAWERLRAHARVPELEAVTSVVRQWHASVGQRGRHRGVAWREARPAVFSGGIVAPAAADALPVSRHGRWGTGRRLGRSGRGRRGGGGGPSAGMQAGSATAAAAGIAGRLGRPASVAGDAPGKAGKGGMQSKHSGQA